MSPEGILTLEPTATESEVGALTVTVVAEDGRGGSVSKEIAITVTPIDDAPVSTGIDPQALDAGTAFDLDVTTFFTDEDSETLTFDYVGTLPTGVTFNGDPLAGPIGFSGTPDAIGSFGGQLSVSDGTSTIFETIVFNVTGTDDREALKIEAEDATTQSPGFFDVNAPAASGGEVIAFPVPGGSGEATFVLPGEFVTGSYEIKIVYFDENDGESQVTLSVDDTDIGTWTLDDDGGGNAAQAANIRERKFTPDEDLQAGSVIKLTAARDAGEWIRIDYIELTPTSADANFAPTVLTPLDTVDYDGSAALSIDLNAVGEFNLPVFTDQEEDALTYSKVAGPEWLQVSPEGVITGTPDEIGEYTVTVGATDVDGSNVTVAETFTLNVTGLPPENLPPAVSVTPVLTELAENADTSASTKVADITVTDGDDIGTNVVSLAGADANAFEIIDNAGAF
ncbi:MAG: putative Ig domain-containing protein, partial [Pseudomonadota bacterium]